MDVAGDWFRLHDPDERTIHTARTIELGRRINEARDALDAACKCGKYRHEDVERLRARLHQLEVMLPLQTQFVKVPYENTLGGFALFTQGETALVPELSGYEGIEYLDPSQPCDLLVYGKHFSIYESAVVVGGVALPREGSSAVVTKDASGNPVLYGTALNSALRDVNGNLIMIGSDGKTILTVKDTGSFDILSRQVMRVRIPGGVKTATREDGQQVVELYVSTPIGISNRLQIPAKATAAPPPPAPSFPVSAAPGYTFIETALTIGLSAQATNPAGQPTGPNPFPPGTRIRIQSNDPSRPLPAAINLMAIFPFTNYSLPVKLNNIPLVDDTYVIQGKQLDDMASQLCKPILATQPSLPIANMTSSSVLIQPAAPAGMVPTTWATTNTLTISIAVTLNPPATSSWSVPVPGGRANATGPALADRTRSGIVPPRQFTERGKDPQARRAALEPARPDTPTAELPPLPSEELAGFKLPSLLPASPVPPGFMMPLVLGQTPTPTPTGSTPLPGGILPPGVTLPPIIPAVPTPGPVPIPAPAQSSQTMVVVPQRGPTVNVSVPITNMPKSKSHSLFHRRKSTTMAPASPAASARGPLMERLMGRP